MQSIENKNPIREVRKQLNLSLADFAAYLTISMSTLAGLEDATYSRIPPTVLRILSPHFTSPSVLTNLYSEYQVRQRATILEQRRNRVAGVSGTFGIPETDYPLYLYNFVSKSESSHPVGMNPFVYWRKINGWNTRHKFGRAVCLHNSTLHRVESGISKEIPKQVKEALSDIGLPSERIEQLDHDYRIWRRERTDGNRPSLSGAA